MSLEARVDVVFGSPLGDAINQWFTLRYGSRMRGAFGMGRTVTFIAPDAWAVDLPVIFGEMRVNPMDWIVDRTDALLRSVGEIEAHRVCERLVLKLEMFQAMQGFRRAFRPDLDASVTLLVEHPIQPGMAKWASLQATEKTLKAFIRLRKEEPSRHGHDLGKLTEHAVEKGMDAVPAELVAQVQCHAGVRYGETPVSLVEAIAAHDAAIEICHSAGISASRLG